VFISLFLFVYFCLLLFVNFIFIDDPWCRIGNLEWGGVWEGGGAVNYKIICAVTLFISKGNPNCRNGGINGGPGGGSSRCQPGKKKYFYF
jgi:hypothetical protein